MFVLYAGRIMEKKHNYGKKTNYGKTSASVNPISDFRKPGPTCQI